MQSCRLLLLAQQRPQMVKNTASKVCMYKGGGISIIGAYSRSRMVINHCHFSTSFTSNKDKKETNPYSHTLNLPNTEFPMRANAVVREVKLQEKCVGDLYKWQLESNTNNNDNNNNNNNNNSPPGNYVLHDGPPFANGEPHLGHALNKILKDIIVRYKMMLGYKVHFRPGWDCHGLPIELKVKKNKNTKDPVKIRKNAREYAKEAIDIQKKEFQRWGILGDWENYYYTMSKDYEANQLSIFTKMHKNGLIYRDFKPVHWSPSSQTALAEAELEYVDDHVSKACYVKFPLDLTLSVDENGQTQGRPFEFLPELFRTNQVRK